MCIYITRLYIILVLPFCNSESKYAFYLFSKFLRGLKRKNVQNLGIIHGKYWYIKYTKITFGLHAFAYERKRVKYITLIPQINFMIRWDYNQAWIGLLFMPWYGMIYMY